MCNGFVHVLNNFLVKVPSFPPEVSPVSTRTTQRWDVLIAGAGPSGMAAAAATAEAGLSTLVLDPTLSSGWTNNYGGWLDELAPYADCAAGRWDNPLVYSDAGGRRDLNRPYLQLDNAKLSAHLRQRAEAAGARFQEVGVSGLQANGGGAEALLDNGQEVAAQIAVDATGAFGRFLERPPQGEGLAWQTAFGVFAEVDEHPWAPGEMVLMDFRSISDPLDKPTFLYAMPTDDRRVFLEETSLACAPAVPVEVLEKRLTIRLAELGIRVRKIHEVERCRIPMNPLQPHMPQAIVGFGAAGGLIHPATGYSVTRSLQSAPALARALVGGLSQGGPGRASTLAWDAVQPASLRRSHRLALAGLEALLGLEGAQLGTFMDAFFAMPQRHWSAYLSGTATPGALTGAMFSLGFLLPVDVLAEVLRGAARGRADLLGGLLPEWSSRAS